MQRSLLFKGVHDGELAFRVVYHFSPLIILFKDNVRIRRVSARYNMLKGFVVKVMFV